MTPPHRCYHPEHAEISSPGTDGGEVSRAGAGTVSLSLLVMAAGVGSRYGGLKQLEPVGPNGELIVDYSVFDALRAGIDRVVFVIRPGIERELRAAVASRFDTRIEVSYVQQRVDDLPRGHQRTPQRAKPRLRNRWARTRCDIALPPIF